MQRKFPWFSLTIIFLVGIFAIFVVFFENFTKRMNQEQIDYAALSLGDPVWKYNLEPIQLYSETIAKARYYTYFEISHPEGEVIVLTEHEPSQTWMNQFFRKLKLIREQDFQQKIVYKNKHIANYKATITNYNIYVYLVGLFLFLLALSIACLLKFLEISRSKRMEAEEELILESKRLHTVLAAAPVITFSIDKNGMITACDGKGLSKLSLRKELILGQHIRHVFAGEDTFIMAYEHAAIGFISSSHHRIKGAVFDVWFAPRKQDSEVVGVMGVLTDISKLKLALEEVASRQQVMQHELQLAQKIHSMMTPLDLPKLPGFNFGLLFVPSSELGGDFVSFMPSEDKQQLGITFTDISGHGVGAALLATMFKVLLDEIMTKGDDIARNFMEMNERVYEKFPEEFFASTFHARLDSNTKTLTYFKAAQDPVYIFRQGKLFAELAGGAPALGLMPKEYIADELYITHDVQLEENDTLFFFTDGLVEIENAEGQMIGRNQLVSWIEEHIDLPPQQLVEKIYDLALDHAGDFAPDDDVTAMVVRVESAS